ncbi:MAG: 1,4-alpha-glucan branching protein GlgB [Saprospirales bacterium]|nr:1,4-alpha-glucan branching protein GlgB [Saprospirales bacterium]
MSEVIPFSRLTDFDIQLFKSGKHFRLYEKLGSHPETIDGVQGTYFAVWAPNALQVAVIGNFNYWNKDAHPLAPRWDGSGIWEGFIPGVGKGASYKYFILAKDGRPLQKGDPFAHFWEIPPNTASIVWEDDYQWTDEPWLTARKERDLLGSPCSVYEVHLGSWRKTHGGAASLNYRQLAEQLVPYVKDMGFTHVEFMPVMEHPYYPSWGYQITGYFAPSSRFGAPEDFKYLVDAFHKAGVGVILDWVPSHFPSDAHGLADFDGTHLYDHADPRKGFHPDWKSCIFNYGRFEVRSFLISNALYWLDQYHADGLRVDAVASMLYLDYSRKEGEWLPNAYGGRENMEAISLLREFNEAVYREYPDALTIAEESTAWTGVSRPTYSGGLGFAQKWMMGWMHDTLKYFKENPLFRSYHHDMITFSLVYSFTENFMLPLSHDEVVHGKGSLITRMPGDEWQRFANLRLLFSYMWTHPGTQLIFMGGEFGQTTEWNHEKGLEWWLTEFRYHRGVMDLVRDLNALYREHPAFHQKQFSPEGFEWIDLNDRKNSMLVYLRKGTMENPPMIVICNFTPVPHNDYKIGAPVAGRWKEIFNSDESKYGGSDFPVEKEMRTTEERWHGQPHSLHLSVPPLSVRVLQPLDYSPWPAEVPKATPARKRTAPAAKKSASTKAEPSAKPATKKKK